MAGDTIILLIGSRGSGKTSFVKFAGGIGVDPSPTTACRAYGIEGKSFSSFTVIDTPGLDDLPSGNLAILKDIAQTLVTLGSPKVTGAIFFHRITDTRLGGSARSHLDIFRNLCGDGFAEQAAFVTTMWNTIGRSGLQKYQLLESELRVKHFSIGPGGNASFRFGNSRVSAVEVLEHFADRPARRQLLFAEEVTRFGSSLSGMRKTSAGVAVMRKSGGGKCVIL
ncbi:nucleolar GTP-binding protein 1 [Echria macrotheca]|uniref:Nucleolar GTP-binding protein 1 n=1 Tax=Echria macrotheca TaxID=438768 RepID=A0AAJ0F3L6_9PEZI|nr:nucleolar GTP-binding protein 1 [Echria macrotheca]